MSSGCYAPWTTRRCGWLASFLFLVGHTHNALDRFFSRLGVSLAVQSYYTLDQLWDVVQSALRSSDVKVGHVTHNWDFKEVAQLEGMPAFHCLRNAQALQLYRRGGVYFQWKQYLTDENWSRPLPLVPAERVAEVGAFRPNRIEQTFAKESTMLSWVDRHEVFLSDANNTNDGRREDLAWLRRDIGLSKLE